MTRWPEKRYSVEYRHVSTFGAWEEFFVSKPKYKIECNWWRILLFRNPYYIANRDKAQLDAMNAAINEGIKWWDSYYSKMQSEPTPPELRVSWEAYDSVGRLIWGAVIYQNGKFLT